MQKGKDLEMQYPVQKISDCKNTYQRMVKGEIKFSATKKDSEGSVD